MQTNKKNDLFEGILLCLICLGVILAILNFLYNRSLWIDEARVALNIVNRSYAELLKPLSLNQVAPIGFLFIEKFFANLFGNHDWTMRIFPLLSFLISIPLFFKLSFKLTQSKHFALLACAIFSLSMHMMFYSSEVKQYSTDVLISVIVVLSSLSFLESKNKAAIAGYTLMGMLVVWFSNVAVIMLFTMGLYSLYEIHIVKKEKNFKVIIPLFFWCVSFVVYYALFIHGHPIKAFMLEFWSNAKAFLPANILSLEFYGELLKKLEKFLGLLSLGGLWILASIVIIVGIVSKSKHKKILFIALFPLLVHLILTYFKLYPFHKRLILYMLPFIVLLYVNGLFAVFEYFKQKKANLPILVLLIPLLINLFPLATKLPIEKEEIKKSMEYVNENITPTDNIYLYYDSQPAFNFYKEKYPAIARNTSIAYGTENRKNWAAYDPEILRIEGNTWMIFSHIYAKKNEEGLKEDAYMLGFLKKKGYKVLEEKKFEGSSVYKVSK
ncbi:MAG: glycosyltransferase family 39 protein [Chitinophagales bacterium]